MSRTVKKYEELPLTPTGTPVDQAEAALVRAKYVDGKPAVARIRGVHTDGTRRTAATSEIVIDDRNKLEDPHQRSHDRLLRMATRQNWLGCQE